MEQVLDFIKKNNMISSQETIGVACSGGRDSMALLHYLNSIKEDLNFKIIVINVDHSIRPNSASDSKFVMDYCKEKDIKAYSLKVDALKISQEKGLSIEQGAREARYQVFDSFLQKNIVDKIATAHHLNDQAETVLLNILRGTGLAGAKGIEAVRDNQFIRPLLNTERAEIMNYVVDNEIPYVEDETNEDTNYSRNYIRNIVLPTIRKKFKAVDKNLANFANICLEDDKFINEQIEMGGVIKNNNITKIPLQYFSFKSSVINRILLTCLHYYSLQDIERRHLNIIKEFAKEGANGDSIDLPFGIKVYKEYDYISLALKSNAKQKTSYAFKKGKTYFDGYGLIRVVATKFFTIKDHSHLVDVNKIPSEASWRFRKTGDEFTPFGGGTKTLKEYFIDKKIPQRLRDNIPVLAIGNQILAVADIEISDNIKVDDTTSQIFRIVYEKELF